jgi:isoleucyl-tRNA synthetase
VYEDGIRESTRQSLLTLWNVFSFFATYADLDGWAPEPGWAPSSPPPAATSVLDLWILAEVAATTAEVTDALEGFDALSAANRIARLIDDLSNWYVRRSRPRFWRSSDPVAHATLHHCLVRTSQLLAPFTPFLADELWGALTDELSVHAADWPVAPGAGDEAGATALAGEMAAARSLVALGGRPAPTRRCAPASRCAGRSCSTPAWRSRTRCGPRSPTSSTCTPSRTSRPSATW